MNSPDHISESLQTIFWVKILQLFDAYPVSGLEKIRVRDPGWKKFGSGMQKIRIRDKHPGSATLDSFIIAGVPLIQFRWKYAVNGMHRRLRQKQRQKILR
jgi:hypothetical protein